MSCSLKAFLFQFVKGDPSCDGCCSDSTLQQSRGNGAHSYLKALSETWRFGSIFREAERNWGSGGMGWFRANRYFSLSLCLEMDPILLTPVEIAHEKQTPTVATITKICQDQRPEMAYCQPAAVQDNCSEQNRELPHKNIHVATPTLTLIWEDSVVADV